MHKLKVNSTWIGTQREKSACIYTQNNNETLFLALTFCRSVPSVTVVLTAVKFTYCHSVHCFSNVFKIAIILISSSVSEVHMTYELMEVCSQENMTTEIYKRW